MSKSNQNVRERRHGLRFASAIRILAMRLERSYQHLECDINACKTQDRQVQQNQNRKFRRKCYLYSYRAPDVQLTLS